MTGRRICLPLVLALYAAVLLGGFSVGLMLAQKALAAWLA